MEIVFDGLTKEKVFEGNKQTNISSFDAMDQRASVATYGAVADLDMIEIGITANRTLPQ